MSRQKHKKQSPETMPLEELEKEYTSMNRVMVMIVEATVDLYNVLQKRKGLPQLTGKVICMSRGIDLSKAS